jgi:hypothetical protein
MLTVRYGRMKKLACAPERFQRYRMRQSWCSSAPPAPNHAGGPTKRPSRMWTVGRYCDRVVRSSLFCMLRPSPHLQRHVHLTANAMGVGSNKGDTLKSHMHRTKTQGVGAGTGGNLMLRAISAPSGDITDTALENTGAAETAPVHTRVAPFIHI